MRWVEDVEWVVDVVVDVAPVVEASGGWVDLLPPDLVALASAPTAATANRTLPACPAIAKSVPSAARK